MRELPCAKRKPPRRLSAYLPPSAWYRNAWRKGWLCYRKRERTVANETHEQVDYPAMPIKATPYNHQREAYELACRLFGMVGDEPISRGTALLMEMGTGKTITSIAITGALYQAGKIRKVLVVAPLSIVGVWDEEFQKFADFDYTLAVLEGSVNKKVDTLRHLSGNPLQVAIINYESRMT